jgi:ribosome biogenesis GTPase
MKQKDKKRLKRDSGRLNAVNLPNLDILDEIDYSPVYKSKRTAHKSSERLKNDLELRPGRILEIKSNYANIVDIAGERYSCSLSGRLKQYKFNTKVLTAVGDYVEVDMAKAPDYRIENILPRKNTLSRYDGGTFQKEIIVAANIDQVIITVSWRMPDIKPGLIDRYLCMARIFDFEPIICITKLDLCEDREEVEETLEYYRRIGLEVLLTSIETGEGMEELKTILKDRESVFSGQSGTGKSSLINFIEPQLKLATAEVSNFNEKGKHTTTQAILIPWSFGGYLVDTPGIKTINLHSDHKALIPKVFPGFDAYLDQCQYRSCTHTHEANCAVQRAVETDKIPITRYDSYLRIFESL